MSHRAAPMPTRRVARRPAIAAAIAVAIALAVSGCGSGSSSRGSTATTHLAARTATTTGTATSSRHPGAPTHTATRHATATAKRAPVGHASSRHRGARHQAAPTAEMARHERMGHRRSDGAGAAPKITTGKPVQHPKRGTGGDSVNDDNPIGKASRADAGSRGAPNPCVVSRAQAASFMGHEVARPRVAPLGPTCIYAGKGDGQVTLAVQTVVFDKLKAHLHGLSRFAVGDRSGYCGRYGSPATYVPLPQDRVLTISAPCGVGRRFAVAALAKLG